MRASSFAFAVLLVGCAGKGDEGMFVVNNTAPVGVTCTLTGDSSQPFIAAGQIAVGSPSGYVLTPLIRSRIDALASQIEQRTIHLEGANVSLSPVSTSGTLGTPTNFTVLFSGSLAPGGTVNVAFDVLPAAMTASAADYSASVTVFGMMGDTRIDAEPFDYPISVCSNCIIVSHGLCSAPVGSMTKLGNPCNPYQDGVVDCCTVGTQQICPGMMM